MNLFIGPRRTTAAFWRRPAAAVVAVSLCLGGTVALGAGPAFAAVQVSLTQSNDRPFVSTGDLFTATVTPSAPGTPVKFQPTGGLLADDAYIGMARASNGYWLAGIDGRVLYEGSNPALNLSPAGGVQTVGIAATPDGGGYFLLGADGSVTAEGDAVFEGDVHGVILNAPVVGIATAADNEYWLLAADGGVFVFGFPSLTGYYGSPVATPGVNAPAVGMIPSSDYKGYTICEEDGACQQFGDAPNLGDFAAGSAADPLVAVAGTPDGGGMWGLHADNTTSAVGDAINPANPNVSDHNTPMVSLIAANGPALTDSSLFVVGLDGQVVAVGVQSVGDAFTQPTNAQGVASIVVTSLGTATTTMTARDVSSGATSNQLQTTWIVPPGYWMTGADGGVFSFGDATYMGSTGAQHLNKPIVDMAATPDGGGYYLVASDGGVFTFGDATFYGSTGAQRLNKPIVGMAVTPDGGGYYLVASDGGVFTFGDATFYGSTGAQRLNKPIVGMASTSDGGGYWLVASDGGIFTFGDATFYGSTGAQHLNQPIVGMATPDDGGYWLVASDGGIFTFGDAPFFGSTGAQHLNKPIIGLAPTADSGGYWLFASDGGVFSFGDATFAGSLGAQRLNAPIVGAASVPFPLLDLSAASTHPHHTLTKSSIESVLVRKGIDWAG